MSIGDLRELATPELHDRYEEVAGRSAAIFARTDGADTAETLEDELDRIETVLRERNVI